MTAFNRGKSDAHLPREVQRLFADRRDHDQLRESFAGLAPFVHHWDANVVFRIDRLRDHTGWEPEYTTQSAVAQTCQWFRQSGLKKKLEFDFSAEDAYSHGWGSSCRPGQRHAQTAATRSPAMRPARAGAWVSASAVFDGSER